MPRFTSSQAYLEFYRRNPSCFGGSLLRGNPKGPRPYHAHQALHVVLRSTRAKGARSLLRREGEIKKILRKQATRFGVRLYKVANSGNHLHLLLKPPKNRADFAGFLRALSGLIARLILRAEKGRAKGIRFWDKRPFSRIVSWGAPFRRCARYVIRNVLETSGLEAAARADAEFWSARTSPA